MRIQTNLQLKQKMINTIYGVLTMCQDLLSVLVNCSRYF